MGTAALSLRVEHLTVFLAAQLYLVLKGIYTSISPHSFIAPTGTKLHFYVYHIYISSLQ